MFFSHVLIAYDQTEHWEPPGDAGLSGRSEERLDKCRASGESLPLGRKCDLISWGLYCSLVLKFHGKCFHLLLLYYCTPSHLLVIWQLEFLATSSVTFSSWKRMMKILFPTFSASLFKRKSVALNLIWLVGTRYKNDLFELNCHVSGVGVVCCSTKERFPPLYTFIGLFKKKHF